MIGEVQSWLPINVTTREVVQAAIREAVDDWSRLWFSRSYVCVSTLKPTVGDPREDADGAGWQVYRKTVAISCSRRASARLADWALDARVGHLVLRKTDRRLVDIFERKLIEDLVQNVERALGIEGVFHSQPQRVTSPFGRLGGVVATLAEDQGGPLLALAIPLQAALPLCRSSIGPASRKPARFASLAHALGSAELSIQATLGNAEIPMGELRSLAPGDVLVLKRGLGDALDMSLHGSENTFAHAKLIDLDGEMALALQA